VFEGLMPVRPVAGRVPDALAANLEQEHLAHQSSLPLWKRATDIVGATILGLVFLPIMALVAILIRRGGGTVLFRHRRIGQNGREFSCYKFRTMVPDADKALRELLERDPVAREEWDKFRKLRKDPRVTPIGRFLRKTSLDELPQIANVLRGEMSLVGPRPVMRDELKYYGRATSKYLMVKPGLTGLWQVAARSEADYVRRVAIDRYYVCKRSPWLDTIILLRTVRVVLLGSGAC